MVSSISTFVGSFRAKHIDTQIKFVFFLTPRLSRRLHQKVDMFMPLITTITKCHDLLFSSIPTPDKTAAHTDSKT